MLLRLVCHQFTLVIDRSFVSLVVKLPATYTQWKLTTQKLLEFAGLQALSLSRHTISSNSVYTTLMKRFQQLRRLTLLMEGMSRDQCAALGSALELHRVQTLSKLELYDPQELGDNFLAPLTGLRSLTINCFQGQIRNPDLTTLTSLTKLSIIYTGGAYNMMEWSLYDPAVFAQHLTGLQSLRLHNYQEAANLEKLTSLHTLSLGTGRTLNDNSLTSLTRLTELKLPRNAQVTNTGLACLTALTTLNISQCSWFGVQGISTLKHLSLLYFYGHDGALSRKEIKEALPQCGEVYPYW
jgi:hypothetical protein